MGANQTALPDLVARLEALEKEATPGDWAHRNDLGEPWSRDVYAGSPNVAITCESGFKRAGDAAITVAMRNALPLLLAELKRLMSENEQLNHSKIIVPEATPELIERAREIRVNRTSEMDALRSANERMRAEQSEMLNAAKPFVNMCTAYEDHTKQFKWSDPIISESIVGSIKFGGNELKHIKMGHLRAIRDAYNSALEDDLRRAAEAVGDE